MSRIELHNAYDTAPIVFSWEWAGLAGGSVACGLILVFLYVLADIVITAGETRPRAPPRRRRRHF